MLAVMAAALMPTLDSTIRNVALAGLAILIDWRWTFHSTILDAGQTLENPLVRLFLRSGTPSDLANLVNSQAAIFAYADATVVIAGVCLACVSLVLLMRRPKAKREAAAPVPTVPSKAPRSIGTQQPGVKAA